jgi:hypothetical protein
LGCQQVDFFVDFGVLEGEVVFDAFHIALGSPGWTFAVLQGGEAEDAYGLNYFFGVGAGGTLTGTFDPFFEAVATPGAPIVRLRAGFSDYGLKAAEIGGTFEGLYRGEVMTRVAFGKVTTAPEPATWLLFVFGLAGSWLATRITGARVKES